MSDESNITLHYHKGARWEHVIAALIAVAVLAFLGGRLSVPPSAEAIAHKQEMERLRSEQAAAEAEAIAEALAMSTTMVAETIEMAMEIEEGAE
jgi:hypothetical protein